MLLVFVSLIICLAGFFTGLARAAHIFANETHARKRTEPCRLAVFLGSGGHTSEVLALVSTLDFARYTPRTYIISEGDTRSAQKAVALEALRSSALSTYQILTVPRARRVHQSLLSTPPSALWSLLFCIYHVTIAPRIVKSRTGPFPADVLLVNGPGTCFVLCVATYVNRCLGFQSPKLIYVESYARVTSLSLSGKLLRRLADRFIVQWPDVLADGGRGECHGWLV